MDGKQIVKKMGGDSRSRGKGETVKENWEGEE